MLYTHSQNRLLLLATAVFLLLIIIFLVSPESLSAWPSTGGPDIIKNEYLSHHDSANDQHSQDFANSREPVVVDPRLTSSALQQSGIDALPLQQQSVIGTVVAHGYPAKETTHGQSQDPAATSLGQVTAMSLAEGGKSSQTHTLLFSKMTPDKKYFSMNFGDYGSYNPNLVPHPVKNDTYVMIAQARQLDADAHPPIYSLELVCEATYSEVSDHCTGDLDWFNYFIGPNDPRVFHGPDKPYITYGSASQYTCLGQWIHDLRRLVKWDDVGALDRTQRFFWPTELKRPAPYAKIEKNWFAFWDHAGAMFLHYEVYPKRSFARISSDGSQISEDLAHTTTVRDAACIQKHMPVLKENEHIHQATNSLAVTMCRRGEATCNIEQNTFIFTIFHHKQYHGHNLYEPYVMMLQNNAPFDIYAFSAKPFWINGRDRAGDGDPDRPADESQMMYMTSMAWKAQNLTYHGYLDDDLLISFGIEDSAAGAIDVAASDLLNDLNRCV